MTRVKSGVVTHARHRKVVKAAKGYYGARSRNFKTAKQAVDRAMQYSTRDRKVRKRSNALERRINREICPGRLPYVYERNPCKEKLGILLV